MWTFSDDVSMQDPQVQHMLSFMHAACADAPSSVRLVPGPLVFRRGTYVKTFAPPEDPIAAMDAWMRDEYLAVLQAADANMSAERSRFALRAAEDEGGIELTVKHIFAWGTLVPATS